MLRRKFIWFGPTLSDEDYKIAFPHRKVLYTDDRGTFSSGYEDNDLSPRPYQIAGNRILLTDEEVRSIVNRIVEWIKFSGGTVYVWGTNFQQVTSQQIAEAVATAKSEIEKRNLSS